jgi:competence protein ComEA
MINSISLKVVYLREYIENLKGFIMKKLQYLFLGAVLLSASTFVPVQAADSAPKAAMSQSIEDKLNINTADAEQLTSLPGVGIKKAQQIVKYRELNGDFKSVDELVNVKGIGAKMVAKISELVKI